MTKRLLLLNGLAVLGVALHHASGYGFRAMFFWTDRYMPVSVPNYDQVGSLPFWIIVLIQQIDAFSLPAFLYVSGFFTAFSAMGTRSTLSGAVLRARISTLLFPFLFWTLFFFLVIVRQFPSSLDEVLDRYYYIVLLIQFYLLAPLLVPLAKERWRLLLATATLLELVRYGVRYLDVLGVDSPLIQQLIWFTPKWLVPTLLFWYVFGLVAAFHRSALAAWLARVRWGLLAALLLLVVLTLLEYNVVAWATGRRWMGPYFGGLLRNLYALFFILTFLAFNDISLPFEKDLSELGAKSLGVYLVHGPAMYVAAVLLYRQAPWVLGNQLLYQGMLVVAGLGSSLLLMHVVRRSPARTMYRYMFG